jgi:hypothetical protein
MHVDKPIITSFCCKPRQRPSREAFTVQDATGTMHPIMFSGMFVTHWEHVIRFVFIIVGVVSEGFVLLLLWLGHPT